MSVVLPLFLMLLAFAGGAVLAYVVMDAPRRLAKERAARLDGQLANAAEFERDLDRRDRRLVARAGDADRREAALARREAAVVANLTEFERRAVSYADLENENRLLRAELKNHALHAAYLDHRRDADRAGHTAAGDQRDELGHAYFREVAGAARRAVTPGNLPQSNQRVRDAAGFVRGCGVGLTPATEQAALDELRAQFEKAVRAQDERERQAELREQMREEQRRQREIEEAEEAARAAEREREAAEAALERARAEAAREAAEAYGRQSAETEAEHAARIAELQARLAEAEENSRRAISNAQRTKQGCVYVISNVGSFGEGVFKIGMTRRDDPMDRVRELGDASVPFPFDVHMKITCDDAPALESALHREFHRRRKNKINLRKEFFEVTIGEVAAAVERLHGRVEYTADAEALEYRNGLTATAVDLAEIEAVFAHTAGRGQEP